MSKAAVDSRASTTRIIEGIPQPAGRLLRQAPSLITIAQTLGAFGHLSDRARALAGLLEVVVVIAWGLATSRREGDWPDVMCLMTVVGAGAWLAALTGNGQVYVLGYSALFVAPFWYRMPRAVIPWVSGVVAVALSSAFIGHRDITGGISNAVGATFFGLAAWFWGRVLESSQRNAELVQELRSSREAESRNAVVAERARLARELHDVLAHTLSSLSLHLESTRVLAKSRDIDVEVQERIERGVALARSGLEEARDAVGTLRDDELPGPERLRSLVIDFQRTAGVTCDFEEVGTPTQLAPEASVALFRSAQESLTNVGKHANASRVDVRLEWMDHDVRLRVVDNGAGRNGSTGLPGGGNGLRGMRERAELAGGRLDAGPTECGFAVELVLPR